MLEKIIKYKEFILISVLFVSGGVWMYGIFATKSYVQQVHCLVEADITASLYQIQVKDISKEIAQTSKEIARTEESDKEKIDYLLERIDRLQRRMGTSVEESEKATKKVTSGECLNL